jgi:hypothetical protein
MRDTWWCYYGKFRVFTGNLVHKMRPIHRDVMSKITYFKIAVPCLTMFGLFLLFEFTFRILVFSDLPFMKKFRHPSLYASYFSDDEYWFLNYYFKSGSQPPKDPHPILGWTGAFDRNQLIHRDAPQLSERRPVLLYGDSFAECVERPCFQDILNYDLTFSKKCYLLNYGVGGYGLDQIYILMTQTVPKYKDPIVIFSLLTEDIDRSVLSVRGGQKPRFRLEGGKFRLTNVPIDSNPADFFERARPRIYSYLLRMVLYGRVLPSWLERALQGEEEKRNEKIALTQVILKEAITNLRGHGLEFSFLVFVGRWKGVSSIMEENDWRLDTILRILKEENVKYINAKSIIREDMSATGRAAGKYFIAGGHYNGDTNILIANRLKIALDPECRSG